MKKYIKPVATSFSFISDEMMSMIGPTGNVVIDDKNDGTEGGGIVLNPDPLDPDNPGGISPAKEYENPFYFAELEI